MRREPKIISNQNRLGIVSDYFQTRLQSCNDVLAENRVDKSITDLRRIYRLIMTKDLEPDEAERANFRRALLALEDFVLSYKIDELKRQTASKDATDAAAAAVADIDFKAFANDEELNEAFLDECWDYGQEGLLAKVKAFLDNKADFNYVDKSTGGLTAFHYASQSDDPAVLKEFLSRGADPNQKYDDGYKRTVWLANHSNNADKIRLFLEHGADVNACDQNGNTVLHSLARLADNTESMRLLIEKGADVNRANKQGQTPIFNAIKYSNVACLNLLIEKGATLNHEDMFNDTPLILAVNFNNPDVIQALVASNQLDKDYRNKHGQTAMDVALHKGNAQLTQMLRQTPESARSAVAAAAAATARSTENRDDDLDDSDVDSLKEKIIASLKKGLIYLHDISSASFKSSMDINVKYEDGVYVETTYFNSPALDDDDEDEMNGFGGGGRSRSLSRYFEEDDDDTVIISDEDDVVIVGRPGASASADNSVIKIQFKSDEEVLEYLYDLNYNYFCYLNLDKSELEVYRLILNKISTF